AGVNGAVALRAQQVLEQHLQREREPGNVEALLQGVEAEDLVRTIAEEELASGIEAVLGHRFQFRRVAGALLARDAARRVRARAFGERRCAGASAADGGGPQRPAAGAGRPGLRAPNGKRVM